MTREEKAKAYDEAIEKAKELCSKFKGITARNVIEKLFPELKESEDEKIRKTLVELVKCCERSGYTHLNNVFTSSMLAWLERQGEQTSDKIVEKAKTEKQKVLLTETDGVANIDWDTRSLDDVKRLLEYGLGYINKLEKQGEQKPDKWEPQTGDTFRKKGTTSPTYQLCDKREDGITFGFVKNSELGISGGEITIFDLRNDYELVERLNPIEKFIEERLNKYLQSLNACLE